jgi:hypothetical protein
MGLSDLIVKLYSFYHCIIATMEINYNLHGQGKHLPERTPPQERRAEVTDQISRHLHPLCGDDPRHPDCLLFRILLRPSQRKLFSI